MRWPPVSPPAHDGPEERALLALRGPLTLPAFGEEALTATFDETLLVTDRDGLWVKPFTLTEDSAAAWYRFTPEGTYAGTVTVPARFRPTAVRGDRVLGIMRDAMDVETVRVFGLRFALGAH